MNKLEKWGVFEMDEMRLLIATVIMLFIITPVSAEIVYSQQFYMNKNESVVLTSNARAPMLSSRSDWSMLYEIRNTNELLTKQNELLQEQNNLTVTQNEILSELYNLCRLWFGYKISGIPGATYGKPLDV